MSLARVAAPAARHDRLPRSAERLLRLAGDGRVGVALLLAVGFANALAALLPGGATLLDAWPYVLLLGALALSGVAAVAVRAPATLREWRSPAAVQPGTGAISEVLSVADPAPEAVASALEEAGYRTRIEESRRGWAVHAVRRGWSRFAAIGSHLALVVVVLGAAIGAAFGAETTFSLLPGDQALLDAPRPGFASAVRLETLDAEFDEAGRPLVLDTRVTFLRDGAPQESRVLRVNEPGDFDGYLVHPWTYGPAARLRVTTLGGAPLLDAAVPLDRSRDGTAVGATELPSQGVTLGLALVDADANELGVSVVGASGVIDVLRLRPGERARGGDVMVELTGFDAWVTFLSRRDPGLLVLFAGALLLSASLAIGFWLPRRRATLRPVPTGLGLTLRGERFDDPSGELARLREAIETR